MGVLLALSTVIAVVHRHCIIVSTTISPHEQWLAGGVVVLCCTFKDRGSIVCHSLSLAHHPLSDVCHPLFIVRCLFD
jgi:hypothetical protein